LSAEYHVPVHLDVPYIDVIYTGIADEQAARRAWVRRANSTDRAG